MMQVAGAHTPRVLVVDDDTRIQSMICRYLRDEGFQVSSAADATEMRQSLKAETPDLILLDLMLPGEGGLDLVRELRRENLPLGIIMLTGRSDMIDKVVGLELGADDYIAKPFHLREVLARIKSVLRRVQTSGDAAPASPDVMMFDGWQLDTSRRTLTSPDGNPVDLTTGEFDLLRAFVQNAGRVLDRDRLMDLTRGRDWHPFDRSIDTQVSRLRRRIELDPKKPTLIKSVRGAGYMLTARVVRGGASSH